MKRADAHKKAAQWFRNLNRVLGGLNIILAAFTATTMFAALNQKLGHLSALKQVVVTFIAVLPAISAGLQKEWQLIPSENGHVLLTQDCRILLKQLELLVAMPPEDRKAAIAEWHTRYTEVISRPAVVPNK